MVEEKDITETKGFGWRVSLSILVGVAWLVFIIIWFFFYAGDLNWEKNVAIFLLSLFLIVLILGAPWTFWAIKHRTLKEAEMWNTKGFRWRVWLSMSLALLLIIFLIYWFWFLAEPYDVYQNIAILIVSFLIIGGILGAAWAPWGIKYDQQQKNEK